MGLPLIDGQINFRGASFEEVLRTLTAELAARSGFVIPPLDVIADEPPLPARINHNRLIVDCPDCQGAVFVWRAGPHLTLCHGCWNARAGHRWRRVAVPNDETLATIERILGSRPLPENRNWQPWERVEDLIDENLRHAAELRPADG